MTSSRSSSEVSISNEDENIDIEIDYSEFSEDNELETEFMTMSDPGFLRHKEILYRIWPPFAENNLREGTTESSQNARLPEKNEQIDIVVNNQPLVDSQYAQNKINIVSRPEVQEECNQTRNNLILQQKNLLTEKHPRNHRVQRKRRASEYESSYPDDPSNYDIISLVILANQELEIRGFPHIDWVRRLTDQFGYFLTEADVRRFYKTYKWEDKDRSSKSSTNK